MSTGPTDDSHLDQPDADLVDRSCTRLGLTPLHAPERLTAGRSGSLVVRLHATRGPMILKVTADPARLARARSELARISYAPDGFAAAMPRYIAGYDDPGAVCLVTEEHETLPRPHNLTAEEWTALATALGKLHNQPVPAWPDLQVRQSPDETSVVTVTRFWAHLGRAEVAERVADLILRPSPSPSPAAATLSVEHGDCHTENIVRDDAGTFRWIDWQEAHLGDGFGDLAFLWQRAEFAGANPPREAMVAAYAASRRLPLGADLHRALDAAELLLLFLSWPPFLTYGAPADQERMLRRLPALVDALSS